MSADITIRLSIDEPTWLAYMKIRNSKKLVVLKQARNIRKYVNRKNRSLRATSYKQSIPMTKRCAPQANNSDPRRQNHSGLFHRPEAHTFH